MYVTPWSALLSIRDIFYFFGGERLNGVYGPSILKKSIISLNPATKKWKLVGNMNFSRSTSHRAILLGNVVFIAGKYSSTRPESELCYFSIENDEVENFVCEISTKLDVSGNGRQLKNFGLLELTNSSKVPHLFDVSDNDWTFACD